MTDQGPAEKARTVRNAAGELHEVSWRLEPPRRWWQLLWRGQVIYRLVPEPGNHYGSLWMEDLKWPSGWSRRHLERRLQHRENVILGFTDREQIYTEGET